MSKEKELNCNNNNITNNGIAFYLRNVFSNTKLNFLIGAGFSFWIAKNPNQSLQDYEGFPIMKIIFQEIKSRQEKIFCELKETKENKKIEEIMKEENIEKLLTYLESKPIFSDYLTIIENNFKNILVCKQIESIEKYSNVKKTYQIFYELLRYITFEINNNTKNSTVNIFTTNYDLYNEIILEEKEIKYYSGFNGFFNRKFNVSYYDYGYYESTSLTNYRYYKKRDYINLIKLHGSLSWTLNNNDELIEVSFFDIYGENKNVNFTKNNPVLVLPSLRKYSKVTYENYYFDLQAYFKKSIFSPNSSILIFGCQLGDLHINNILKEARNTRNTNIIIFCRNKQEYEKIKVNYPDFLFFYHNEQDWTCLDWISFLYQEIVYNEKNTAEPDLLLDKISNNNNEIKTIIIKNEKDYENEI